MKTQDIQDEINQLIKNSPSFFEGMKKCLEYLVNIWGIKGAALVVQELEEYTPLFVIENEINLERTIEKYPDILKIQEDYENSPVSRIEKIHPVNDTLWVFPLIFRGTWEGYLIGWGNTTEDVGKSYIAEIIPLLTTLVVDHRHPRQIQSFFDKLNHFANTFAGIKQSLSIDKIEKQLVNSLRDLFSSDIAAIGMVEQNRNDILLKRYLKDDKNWIYQIGVERNQGITGICFSIAKPFLGNRLEKLGEYDPEFDGLPNEDIHSIMCVPIKDEDMVIGVLSVLNSQSKRYTENDLEIFQTVAQTIVKPILLMKNIQQLQVINAHLEASRWELIRSRNTLRSLIDNLPDSLYIIDRMYRIVAINNSRSKRVKGEPRFIVGKVCFDVLYDREEPCPNCQVPETFFKKKVTNRTGREWLESGEPLEWDISTYPIFDETGGVIQVILVEKDVTERRRMESIITQSEKMAAVGQLAAGIAHEINNPLTVILANAQILTRELPDQEDWIELAEMIHKAGSRALHTVRNLLNFARKEQLEFTETDINETLERALEMLKHEIMERSVNLVFEPGENIPMINASASNLQSVWLNLIINAMDSTLNAPPEIKVKSFAKGSEIRVSITDNGQGISPDGLSRIFEPFYTTKDPGKGTGLGLSICHRIIKQHDGHITVDSQVGEGTTFTIVLPTY